MSAMCAMHSAKATRRPRWKSGATTAMSFRCPMIHHGLLVATMSPGRKLSAGMCFSISFTAIEIVPVLEATLTSAASSRPCGSSSSEPKSRPSTTTFDIDVRTMAYAASSTTRTSRFHRISRSMGSNARRALLHIGNFDVQQRRVLLRAVDVGVADVAGRDAPRDGRLERVAGADIGEQHVLRPHVVEPREERRTRARRSRARARTCCARRTRRRASARTVPRSCSCRPSRCHGCAACAVTSSRIRWGTARTDPRSPRCGRPRSDTPARSRCRTARTETPCCLPCTGVPGKSTCSICTRAIASTALAISCVWRDDLHDEAELVRAACPAPAPSPPSRRCRRRCG